MLLWLQISLAHAGCMDDALAAADGVETAFATLAETAFDEAAAQLDAALPCLESIVTPGDAARIHRARALVGFVLATPDRGVRSWAAVRAVSPDWLPSTSLLPPGHPARTDWERAYVEGGRLALPEPPAGGWYVDGIRVVEAPAGRAFLLQGLGPTGAVVHSGYHLEVSSVPLLPALPPPPVIKPPRKTSAKVMIGGGSALLVGGAAMVPLYLGARSEWQTALNAETGVPPERAQALQDAVNRRGAAAATLGGLGVVALSVGFALPR